MFFSFFIFPRNTIFGAAEQKCSAEHRLRNPDLNEQVKMGKIAYMSITPFLLTHAYQRGHV
jgi:hypothetical protein